MTAQRRLTALEDQLAGKKSRIKSLKALVTTSSELQSEFSNKFGAILQETNGVVDKLNAQRKQSMSINSVGLCSCSVSNLEAKQSTFAKIVQEHQQVSQAKSERIQHFEEKIRKMETEGHQSVLKLEAADAKIDQQESQLERSLEKIKCVVCFRLKNRR